MAFNPARLTLARKRRGFTKSHLAQRIGVVVRNVHRYEDAEVVPSPETLSRIATVLEFPVSFFGMGGPPELAGDSASFRSLSTMTLRQRDSVLAAGTLALELCDLLETHLTLPPLSLSDLRETLPEEAARQLRSHWKLVARPIPNVVHLLESKGIRVFSLAEDCADIDAFTVRHRGVPFVFLNTMKSGERGRFDGAHELGHVCLHSHGDVTGREAERQADAFASSFLMPQEDVIAHAPRLPSIADLMVLKRRWGVSVSALARRLHDLRLIRDWHYKQLCIQLAEKGFRKSEPEGLPRETSLLLRKAFEALRTKGLGRYDLAQQLNVTVRELDSLVFGLVLAPIDGGKHGGGGPSAERPLLRRIK